MLKSEELDKIKKSCLECNKCPLHATRTNIVFSSGNPEAKIMLVGEAPGYWEDVKAEPFVGKAGQLLDKIFLSVGLSREKDIYICNTLKCRPPENRDPLPDEKTACYEYLKAQIDIIKPKIILICGRVSLNTFFPELNCGISKVRGKWFDGENGVKMMPIFHPSYLLRNDSRTKGSPKWLMWQDIQEIKRVYDSL